MRAVRKLLPLIALLVVAAACGGEGQPQGSESPIGQAVEDGGLPAGCVDLSESEAVLTADGLDWDPLCLALAPGQDLTVRNPAEPEHTFTIEDAGIDVALPAGAEEVVPAVGDATEPGVEIEFVCRLHPGMVGYLNVI